MNGEESVEASLEKISSHHNKHIYSFEATLVNINIGLLNILK